MTYHDPCHLRNHGITKEPRAILKALPQVDFVELPYPVSYRAGGNLFRCIYHDTSKKIGAKKAVLVEETGADLVATDCPGCIMQLQDSINHSGGNQRAVHILDLLAEALEKPEYRI